MAFIYHINISHIDTVYLYVVSLCKAMLKKRINKLVIPYI